MSELNMSDLQILHLGIKGDGRFDESDIEIVTQITKVENLIILFPLPVLNSIIGYRLIYKDRINKYFSQSRM